MTGYGARYAMYEEGTASEIAGVLLQHAAAAVAILDRQMRYLACSQRWLSAHGLDGVSVIGRSHPELFPEADAQWTEMFGHALAGETISRDFEAAARDGVPARRRRWTMTPWRDRDGEVGGVVMVSEASAAHGDGEAVAESRAEALERLIEAAPEHAICLLDGAGLVKIWNSGAERLYGWSEAEADGMPLSGLFDRFEREEGAPAARLEEAREKGCARSRTRQLRKDGGSFLAEMTICRTLAADGSIAGFGLVVQDVTEEDAWARSAQANEVHLRSILDTVPDAMVVIDERGIVESFSKTAEKLFGYDAGEVVGRNVSMLMPSPDREGHDGYIARYLATGEPRIMGTNRRVLGRRKDGSLFPHELSVGEAIVADGKRVFTGFLRDQSQREEAEARLQELQSELLHISRVTAVGTMATALAHELNQPLMAISNYVQTSAALLAERENDALDLVQQALEDAGREALRAGAVVRRLREFVSRGELERTIEDPGDLAREACTIGGVGAEARGVHCAVKVEEGVGRVLVDRVQIQQVLTNLIRNALDAIEGEGSIEIRVAPGGTMTRFSVADTGPGIAPEQADTLFHPFASSKDEGMGLGLSICRTIVEAHGGRIWHEAGETGGAVFCFTVPMLSTEGDDDE